MNVGTSSKDPARLVHALIAAGADVGLQNDDNGDTPLHLAAE
jgi:ankyrin repeat protein